MRFIWAYMGPTFSRSTNASTSPSTSTNASKDTKRASLSAEWHVWTFGCGISGRLGHGDQANCARPTFVAALQSELRGRYREVASVSVSAGGAHSLIMVTGTADRAAVAAAGEGDGEEMAAATEVTDLYAFGWNRHGQLGLGDKESRLLPVRLLSLKAGRG